MDEVQEFCRRVLGAVPEADEAAAQAQAQGVSAEDRVALLAAAARECRLRTERPEVQADHVAAEAQARDLGLAGAVAAELAGATAALPERQREVLALRELLRLSYEEISQVMDIEQAAVAPLLARARLRLRVERRGTDLPAGTECSEGERALRLLAGRQDSEPLSAEDDGWLLAHMSSCPACEIRHAAMLEASVCYRAWPRELPRPGMGAEHGQ